MSSPAAILRVRDFSKSFGGQRVLDNFNWQIMPGEICALVGQNGSGKSSFIKSVAGYQAPDEGSKLEVRGEEIELPLAAGDARRLNLSFVHQDLGLVNEESVLDNFLLSGFSTPRSSPIKWRAERKRVAARLAEFGVAMSVDAAVSSLSDVERAMLAIVRAVDELDDGVPGLLVLDESTAYLPRDGIDKLFAVVRRIAASGCAVLFVTHRLEEVWAVANSVTILRDGKLIGTHSVADLDEPGLVELILGFAMNNLYPDSPTNLQTMPRVLEVKGATGTSLDSVDLDLHAGEIIGVTGLLGMGWEELPYLLFGSGSGVRGGELTRAKWHVDLSTFTPAEAIRHQMALLPAHRLTLSGIGDGTLIENLTLPELGRYFRRGRLRRSAMEMVTSSWIERLDVRPVRPHSSLKALSGGNQQKVLLAKWFETTPSVYLLHEPTQGVDIGAKKQIFAEIARVSAEGAGVLIASSDYADLAHLCDRVLVFKDGRVASEIGGTQLDEQHILDAIFREQGSLAREVRQTVSTQP